MKRDYEALRTAGLLLGLMLAIAGRAGEPKEIRAARSVHLSYPAKSGLLFYNEVAVEKSVNGSYFMACGWDTGYFGIQQLDAADEKLVLFSVWDPAKGDDPNATPNEDRVETMFQATDVQVKRFGGEGTGGQCLWRHNWKVGETNRFIISARVDGRNTEYSAWFHLADHWKKLASFRVRTGGKPLSGYYSFIEDFRRDGKSAREQRRALFLNGLIKTEGGDWVSLSRARFTASAAEWESKDNIDAGVSGRAFYLATGGDVRMSRELRSVITLPFASRDPAVLLKDLPSELQRN